MPDVVAPLMREAETPVKAEVLLTAATTEERVALMGN